MCRKEFMAFLLPKREVAGNSPLLAEGTHLAYTSLVAAIPRCVSVVHCFRSSKAAALLLPRRGVPQPHGAVVQRRGKVRAVGREGQRVDLLRQILEHEE